MGLILDEVDVGIIEELQQNGRALLKDIARKAGVSLPTIRSRIQRLRDLGVIRKFSLVVDPDKFYGKIRAFLLLQVNPGKTVEVAERLSNLENCREVFVTAGSSNVIVKLEAESVSELGRLITQDLQQMEGVVGLSCYVITTTQKEEYGVIAHTNVAIQHTCDFCGGSIIGKPHVEIIHGGRYYFTGAECAEAFKKKLEEQAKARKERAEEAHGSRA